MAYGAPPPVYGPPQGPAPAPYGMPPQQSPPPMMAPPPVAPVPMGPVPQPVSSKPDGIMLIAALEFVYAFIMMAYAGFFIWLGMVVMAAANAVENSSGVGGIGALGAMMGGVCIAFGVIYLLFAIIFIVLAWGMMNLKPWARKFTIILMIISFILNLFGLASGEPISIAISVIEILLAVVILIYLFKPNIKAAFEPPMIVAGPGPIMVGGQMPPAYGPPPPMYAPQGPPGYGAPPPQAPPGYGPPPPQAPPPY